MRKPIHDEAIELILASMSQKRGEGVRHSFLFGKRGAPHWGRRIGIDLSYRRNKLIRTALHVRQNGPAYLKYLAIGDIWTMLQDFVSENYSYLFDDVSLKRFEGSYAEQVSSTAKNNLAIALAASEIFQPRSELTLFPIVPITSPNSIMERALRADSGQKRGPGRSSVCGNDRYPKE